MTIDEIVKKNPESRWQRMWKATTDFDRGMDMGSGMGFYFTLWSSIVGLHFLGSEKARRYEIQIHDDNESYAKYIGAEVGMRIGLLSAVTIQVILILTTFPYSLGVLAATNTAGYFHYKRKMKQRREEKRLELPEK